MPDADRAPFLRRDRGRPIAHSGPSPAPVEGDRLRDRTEGWLRQQAVAVDEDLARSNDVKLNSVDLTSGSKIMVPHCLATRRSFHRQPPGHHERVGPSALVLLGVRFRFRPRLEVVEDRTLLSTFLVDTTADSGAGSLRQAILDSNAATSGTNTIDFAIAGEGVQTIMPITPLPSITQAVLIDGFSQPAYGGMPLIELNGSQAGGGDGLMITGSNVTIRGLDIDNFSQGAGIHITGTNATCNWIYGDFLGTDPTGTLAEPNDQGAAIDGGATHDLIGTNGDGIKDEAERNLISGNALAGIWINGPGTEGNVIAGNFIGTSVSGDVALDNCTSPIYYSESGFDIAPIGGGVVIVRRVRQPCRNRWRERR